MRKLLWWWILSQKKASLSLFASILLSWWLSWGRIFFRKILCQQWQTVSNVSFHHSMLANFHDWMWSSSKWWHQGISINEGFLSLFSKERKLCYGTFRIVVKRSTNNSWYSNRIYINGIKNLFAQSLFLKMMETHVVA